MNRIEILATKRDPTLAVLDDMRLVQHHPPELDPMEDSATLLRFVPPSTVLRGVQLVRIFQRFRPAVHDSMVGADYNILLFQLFHGLDAVVTVVNANGESAGIAVHRNFLLPLV